jgi:putative hydrolase
MNLKILPRVIEGVIVLRGAECNIMDYNGALDLHENILSQLDWVIASYHDKACPAGSENEHTNSYIELAKNPLVDLIGHSESDEYKYDYEKALPVFKEYGKFLEINNHSLRIRAGSDKNSIELLKICKKIELPIVLNSDSHYHTQLGDVSLLDEALQAVNFPTNLIFNADYDRFIEYIEKKRNRKIK